MAPSTESGQAHEVKCESCYLGAHLNHLVDSVQLTSNTCSLLSVLTRPEHLQAVFKDSDKHFKAKNNNSGYLMSRVLGHCIGLISGQEWKTARIAFEQPFLRSAAVDYVPMIQKHVSQYFEELHRTGPLERGLLGPADDLKLLPFWIVAEVFYGELDADMISELRDLAHTREELFKHVIHGGISRFSISKYLPTQANRLLSQFQARWIAFNEGARRRAVSLNNGAPIVTLYELAEKGTITKEQLLQTLDESLYANLDVTTGGISWNIVFLAAYRHYQDKLRQEAAEAPDREQYIRTSSTLLAACISESSRLKPLAAFSVPQAAPTTRIVDGYAIPAGTDFIVDSNALNIRNEFWGEDAAVYRPERFLEKGNTQVRYQLWRFGFGPRQCMGKYVADLVIRALVVYLVENYDVNLLEAEASGEWGRNPECWINHPGMNVHCVRRTDEKLSSR